MGTSDGRADQSGSALMTALSFSAAETTQLAADYASADVSAAQRLDMDVTTWQFVNQRLASLTPEQREKARELAPRGGPPGGPPGHLGPPPP